MVLMKVVAKSVSDYCEPHDILPDEQRGTRSGNSTVNMQLVVRRLYELGR